MRRRAVTMKDVAEQVGVSVMTVSAVLGGKTTTVRVSESTRLRVVETAQRMNYRPNAIARSLRRRRTDLIGVYCGYGYFDARNAFYAEIIGGLQTGCYTYRKDLLLHGIFRGHSVDDIYTELLDGRVDGLIVIAPQDDTLVDRLADSHLPVVAVVDAVSSLPSVVVDDAEGSRMLVDYLDRKGHKQVLYKSTTMSLVSARRRRAAFMEEAAVRGMEVSEWSTGYAIETEGVAQALRLDMPVESRPSVAVCWNDDNARILMTHLGRLGIQVPDDLAVVGFDGFLSQQSAWRLTTVRAPWAEVARVAVELLVAQLDGKEAPAETVLPVEFVAGDTA